MRRGRLISGTGAGRRVAMRRLTIEGVPVVEMLYISAGIHGSGMPRFHMVDDGRDVFPQGAKIHHPLEHV